MLLCDSRKSWHIPGMLRFAHVSEYFCEECEGTGTCDFITGVDCRYCNGTGMVEFGDEFDSEECYPVGNCTD